jgi:hypothetical protein
MKYVTNLVCKSEENCPLGRPRRRWNDNIKLDLRKTGLQIMDLICLAQDRDRWHTHFNLIMTLFY